MSGLTEAQRKLVEAVSRAVEVVRLSWVFGSRIHGKPRADSDLDVGVVYARSLSSRERELARREELQRLTDELGSLGEWADVVDLDRAASIVGFNALKYGVLALAAGLRNLLVHDYVVVDVAQLAETVATDLRELREFADLSAAWQRPA